MLSSPPEQPLSTALPGRISRAVKGSEGAAEAAARSQRIEDDDRRWIARAIIVVFAGAIAGVLFLLALRGLVGGNAWSTVADRAADLVKTAVLPIVTLVLGYYFGRAGRS